MHSVRRFSPLFFVVHSISLERFGSLRTRIAARGKALGPELSVIAATSLDKTAELDALASQRELIYVLVPRSTAIGGAQAGAVLRGAAPVFLFGNAELAEIDENLIRANLSPAQEAQAVARRKAIYETLHPETKAGSAGASARWDATAESAVAFTTATAKATGKAERTIREIAARGKALGASSD